MVSIQEMIVIDDLLSALTGIDGRYISIKKSGGVEDSFSFHVDGSMDLALQARMFTYVESAKRIFPLCKSYLLINQFVESRSQFKSGLVNHAFAAALRALLLMKKKKIMAGVRVSDQSRLERKRNKHTHTHLQKIKNTRIYMIRSR
ncbi:putative gamma-tubulin complex component protein [Helianthus anomalus]